MPAEAQFDGGREARFLPTITFVEDSPTRVARLDVNKATAAELAKLPGINSASARKIVAARRKKPFLSLQELVERDLISSRAAAQLNKRLGAKINEEPNVFDIATRPEHVLYKKAFKLQVAFDDSTAGVRLIRLQADSVSHAIDVTREVTKSERRRGRIVFDMPAMAAGVMNVQATLYDSNGDKDYLARALHIYHNPPFVIFYPSQKSLRLSRGAAQMRSDGNFHCDSNFYFYNGTSATVSLNRSMIWKIFSSTGSLLHNGTWDWGSTINLGPWAISTGWWFNFSIPPGTAAFSELSAKDWIRIEWQFTEVGTGALVSDSLTWRAVLGPHVNIIRVGEGNFTSAEKTRVFNALRNSAGSIYQQQDIDIGNIGTYVISVADAGGYVTINSNDEAEDLTEDWTVPNDAIDMFVVRSYVGSTAGLSPVGGPCDKDAKGMNGAVVELQSSQACLGVIMAHELGHYMGLSHTSATNNLLNPTICSGNTVITSGQGNSMKNHCFIEFLA